MTGAGERYLPEGWTLPALTDENRAFFTSGELRLQRCTECGALQHPPADVCSTCQALELDDVPAEAVGSVASYTIVHHALHPLLKDAVPYNVVIVSLRDHPGLRIVGNLVGVATDEIQIGMVVEGEWATVENAAGEKLTLLQWRPAQ